MMMTRTRLLIFLFLLIGTAGFAQNLSNKGKEFWVGYGHHQFFETGANSQEMVIYLSADQLAHVTVSINGTTYSQSYTVPANTVISTATMPKSGPEDCRLYSGAAGFSGTLSEGISDHGIHIVSDVPIVAYAHIYGSQSSGATMLMPIDTYGYTYVSVNSQQHYGNGNCFSWVYVIAKENNTMVEITPSVNTRGGHSANLPYTVLLNKGQVYQVLGATISGNTGYDMTGTKVRSIANPSGQCFPIAVFSGSSRTYITCNGADGNGGDNVIQQIFPFQAWGRHYLTAPTSNASGAASAMTNMYRVAVKDPSTVVKVNGVQLTGLVNNTYYDYTSGNADYIESDKPILVAQYMPSNGSCPNTTGNGDPEMMYISPMEQAIKKIGFYRTNRESIIQNYLTLIIPAEGMNSLTIDGSSSFTYTYDHPNKPGYTVVVQKWNAAAAQCIVQSDSAFTAVTYGLGAAESYGYNAGTLINNLNVIGSIHNTLDAPTPEHAFTCPNSPTQISMLVAYKPTKMVWQLSQVPALSPHTDVTVLAPVPVDSVTVNGVKYYKYTLPDPYTFNTTGSFQIPVLNTHPSIDNCNNSEVVNFSIIVKPAPTADFTFTHSGCVLDSVHFSSPVTTANSYTVGSWTWTYDDASTSDVRNPVKLFTTPGDQHIRLHIVSAEGCVGDTVRTITIYPKPTATFGAAPLNICEGSTVSFTDTSSYTGPGALTRWYWDFGNTPGASVNSNAAQNITYNTPGDYTVKHVAMLNSVCVSDTAIRVIKVFARPVLQFSYPAGCLPSDGLVQFTNNTSVPDGQTISHAWDFGDPSSGASNTSTTQSPSHHYAVGTYTIHYSATTVNGCMRDTTFTTPFNIRPLLSFQPQAAVCASVRGTVSVAGATVTNGVAGHGIYKGPGIDTLGHLDPSLAGPGVHTIWYVFTSNGGCTDSVSSSVKVWPKPMADFTLTNSICLNQSTLLTDHSTLSNGQIVSWNWNFGDGTSNSFTGNTAFNKSYSAFGNYMVKLVAVSDSGCVSDTVSKPIAVHAMPLASFGLPASVCLPDGSANFTNNTTIGDNSALNYSWDFGDNDGSTAMNPSHHYAAGGSYNVLLTVTSAYGCADDTTRTMSAFFQQPVSKFTVAPDTLCQGSNNVFHDLSTAQASTIQSWNWNFGDGTSSADQNPVKKYTAPGHYQVTLTVRNAVGCVSTAFKDTVIVYLQPVIDAGPSFVVPVGTIVHFSPTANDSSVLHFAWSPALDFSNANLLREGVVATHNQTYTLTATGEGNCTASDTLNVKILKPVTVPNSFSPNGDGINDVWKIPNLADYPGCTVVVFNRYGQKVYESSGYGTPWDGTYKGTPVPFATYYYVITLKNGFAPVTGSVTIVR